MRKTTGDAWHPSVGTSTCAQGVVGSTRGGRASPVHRTEVTAAERKKLRPGTKTTSIVTVMWCQCCNRFIVSLIKGGLRKIGGASTTWKHG